MTARNNLPLFQGKLKRQEILNDRRQYLNHSFASPSLLHFSPCRTNRPASWNSLTSRLSTSHNSLVTQFQADDSNFITQAISHDILSGNISDITDMYNVPCDSDIYAVPVDMIRPCHSNIKYKEKKPSRNRKRGKSSPQNITTSHVLSEKVNKTKEINRHKDIKTKRHSLPTPSYDRKFVDSDVDSLHLTVKEMRKYLQTFYSSSSDSDCRNTMNKKNNTIITNVSVHHDHANKDTKTAMFLTECKEVAPPMQTFSQKKSKINSFGIKAKTKKHKDNSNNIIDIDKKDNLLNASNQNQKAKLSPVRILSINIKQSFCNLFRWRRQPVVENLMEVGHGISAKNRSPPPAVRRALPPLPEGAQESHILHSAANEEDITMDFATSIQRVKDYAWYWGNISVDAAEKILSNEPDGSFIVRDSSDDHYIFTLTFKLNGMRHVRIEHNQGNFCFGGCTMFKAQTIVEFIENAVETSRSGRYLFFLNLRPMLGPVRVQLLYPVSRFKRVQSLQHMCRFLIVKNVRRDLISTLPLPRRILDYLNATHYYSEVLAEL